MEQFDEIEKLFKQLEDAGNPPISEAHLADLNKRLDNYNPELKDAASGVNKVSSLFKIAAVALIGLAAFYITYNKLTNKQATDINNTRDISNTTKTLSETNSITNKEGITVEKSTSKPAVKSISENGYRNQDNEQIIANDEAELSEEKNEKVDLKRATKQNTVAVNKESVTKEKETSKKDNIILSYSSKQNNNSGKKNTMAVDAERTKPVLFKLISEPQSINQLLCEGEKIAEIKYIISYVSVNPLIYLDLPKGMSYTHNNNTLVVKGTPENVWGKQMISIKARANNIYDSANFTITVIQKPKAKFSYEAAGGISSLKVAFINDSKGANAYLWDFGDGSTSTSETPNHKYVDEGLYKVTLKAIANSDKSSCEELAASTIMVGNNNLPTAFSPNGDGKTDLFIITPIIDLNFKAEVYNYKSEKVAELSNSDPAWDGHDYKTNAKCPEGTYYYTIIYKDKKGNTVKEGKGNIRLLK